ncbi:MULTISPECIES: twin-arginine translocase TatA/TatE family subunit [Anaeromyxobacter]|jgi:sec-independent protein translocase protein TatA|uniref:Sec-independent protein translocase protein TatA n=2 Tax=Anaeromyxobacter dehalogenans TaxID=161493 RepID=TATA_ANADE|nr:MULTISPECIES: twin-arginine translocase TatA/TatE family subunit [Anaeromyxobacter]Q2IQM4.1 RecName: Full=Sec-independent protein translocase protein TatA [Anaeromyxobacter dehalogenans 2CP-C]ABC81106.1 sec-independent translocation protein mttA/Hcf106 [Anaeromyxobacter dehalogenans 2CP-C]ACG73752.1 sec-independent translocation protein mttA/Hcf106 [Anaeromyxobacter sp. K]ACL65960.1 sec-independent translocation protein mttA/Hcf106 [Anaeromyxobacter dehalogenans 2CP-1]GAO03410.1 sec-indepen
MFGLRMPELLLILAIVVILFGASRLPALGAGLGQGIRSFKKAFGGEDEKPTASGNGSTPTQSSSDQGSKQA